MKPALTREVAENLPPVNSPFVPDVDRSPTALHILGMMFRLFLLAFLLPLVGCDSGAPGKMSLSEYENEAGEALARYMLKTVPNIDPAVPKVYTVVKGEALESASMNFVRRLADTKLTFISGEVLTLREPDKSIVDPRSGLAPITIQLTLIESKGEDTWAAVAAWAYKKTYERRKYQIVKTPAGFEVTDLGRIEGNYVKPDEGPDAGN